ncbi:hydroxymethylbilane synthase [Legionella israelensis]|uniref:Porphobilinogen deaminase n=1 Tax=Legionella israelensis TaxID=454 RepID=A0AAX1EIS5_9GAMM|nr:hydroxymethylbilane synthase [Legionella israelensis]QBR85040.1 hydroxymethylbilane synthase [Legionella israelensis]
MTRRTLHIATRKSPLALWQANHVREQLLSHWPELTIELLPMSTSGDTFNKDKLLAMGGKGLFIKELEEALLDKKADLAVHSMKDVPAEFPNGLALKAICKRGDPHDALISIRHDQLKSLPKGAIIGTSSLRRQSQLLALRPDLNIQFLRGNINTRLKKLHEGKYDAIILAVAGLERMKLQYLISEILSDDVLLPACGQGALGIECRMDDPELHQLIAPLNDPVSSLCVQAERQVNARLGGNCHIPVAVYCRMKNTSDIIIRSKVSSENGQTVLTAQEEGPKEMTMELAERCAQSLIDQGANQLLKLNP